MRLGKLVVLALGLALPAIAAAQTNSYLGGNYTPSDTVIRPASTTMFRNYVTVPDGPCGTPMSVEADCYNPTCRPCGPLHPVCFAKRVGRMLDCLLPCNLCCRGCGCGLFHGCGLGGRTWGHCSVCSCGGACGGCGAGGCGPGGCGPSGYGGCSNGCVNPAGSVFDAPCCSCGQCDGCSCGAGPSCCDAVAPPMLGNPFQDDPMPPTPMPTSMPAEVRRPPARQLKPVSAPPRESFSAKDSPPAKQTAAVNNSPYKIVNQQPPAAPPRTTARRATSTITATEEVRTVPARSVLRRASVESESVEPAPHNINRARALPIIRSQSPEPIDQDVPLNPLR
jgi:hypothetical protein